MSDETPDQRISLFGFEDIVYNGPGKLESYSWERSGRLTITVSGYRPSGDVAEPRGIWPL